MVSAASASLGFWMGVVAAAAALAVLYAVRSVAGVPTPTDLLADRVTALLPLSVFAALLSVLEDAAKPMLHVALILSQLAAGGVGGVLFLRQVRPGPGLWLAGLVLALALWFLLGTMLMPFVGAGAFATTSMAGPGPTMTALLAAVLVYGLGLAGLCAWLRDAAVGPRALGAVPPGARRKVITGLGAAIVLVGLGTIVWRLAGRVGGRAVGKIRGMPPEITPNADFYTVSKNIVDPVIDARTWRLEIKGQVAKPYQLTYDELRALESVEQVSTLECISNEVGGDLISNAVWRGVRLRDLIARAEPSAGLVKVVFRCADGYEDSIPFSKAMEPTTLLAYEMNGEPLPPAHGFPARVIVPNIYGMKNAKWVTEIRLLDTDFKGYWQQRGWSDEAVVKTMSRIDVPGPKRLERGPTLIGGIAFAGARGIEKVEVSVDGGKTWHEARVKPPLSKMAWALWTYEWLPAALGTFGIVVRATDGHGRLQEQTPADPLPDGKQGYHDVLVTVVEPETPRSS